MDGFGFSWVQNQAEYWSIQNKIIVDSGTSFVLMPPSDYKMTIDYINSRLGTSFRSNDMFGQISSYPSSTCTKAQIDQMPDMIFVLEGQVYTVPKESYLDVDHSYWGQSECYLKFMSH